MLIPCGCFDCRALSPRAARGILSAPLRRCGRGAVASAANSGVCQLALNLTVSYAEPPATINEPAALAPLFLGKLHGYRY